MKWLLGVQKKGNLMRLSILTALGLIYSSAAFAHFPETFSTHAKQPTLSIYKSLGIGTENASLEAKLTKAGAADWCNSWQPGDKTCVANTLAMSVETYMASANCKTGSMTDPHGNNYVFDGIHMQGDWAGHYAFKNTKTGKRVGTSNAEGGLTLASQWFSLCPFGLPYKTLPLQTILPDASYDMPGDLIVHNKQSMKFVPDLGVIAYSVPKASFIKPHTVLFRGFMTNSAGSVQGMAYTFKKGCEPAPYFVEGWYDGGLKLTLTGAAPIRSKTSCAITGYTRKSPHATLDFFFEPEL